MVNGALTSNLKLLTAFDPNRRVSLFFRAFEVSIFPSLVMKVQDVTFFHYKAALSTLKIYCLVVLLSLMTLARSQ